MIEEDRMIRDRLSPLRRARIPDPPAVVPASVRGTGFPFGRVAAAAVMLLALTAVLSLVPPREEASSTPAHRLAAVEAQVADVRDDGLRSLLRREIELLRQELRIAAGGP